MPEVQFFLMPSDQKDLLAEILQKHPAASLLVTEGVSTAGCQDEDEVRRRRQLSVMRAMPLGEFLDWDMRESVPSFKRPWLWHTEFAPGPGQLPLHGEEIRRRQPSESGLIDFSPCVLRTLGGGDLLDTGRFAVNKKSDFEYARFERYEELRGFFESVRRLTVKRFAKDIECWYRLWRGDGTWWRSRILRASPAVWDAFCDGLKLRDGNSPYELRRIPKLT